MKKTLAMYSGLFILYFALAGLFNRLYRPEHIVFYIGGLLGILLPLVDRFLLKYLLKPKKFAVDQAITDLEHGNINKSLGELGEYDNTKDKLIFHTAVFQLLFLIIAFYIVSSSRHLLASGIVLGFMLHLSIAQGLDLRDLKTIDHWFRNFPISLDQRQKIWFFVGNIVFLLLFGFLFM